MCPAKSQMYGVDVVSCRVGAMDHAVGPVRQMVCRVQRVAAADVPGVTDPAVQPVRRMVCRVQRVACRVLPVRQVACRVRRIMPLSRYDE